MSPQIAPPKTKLAQRQQNFATAGIEKFARLNLCQVILLGKMTSASNRLRRTASAEVGDFQVGSSTQAIDRTQQL
jgi:hypothetical protein